jgi:3-oxoadipate enol-lactonase
MSSLTVMSGEVALNVECDDFTDPWREAPTLLLLHGFGRSSKMWYPLVPQLARHFRVLRLDLRGLGRSGRNFDPATEITLDQYVEDTLAVVRQLCDGPVHLCGESIGGIVSAAFAARHPRHVATLTLISTPAFLAPEARSLYACGHATPAAAMEALGAREWLRRTNGSTRFPPDMPPGFLQWFDDEVAGADPGVLSGMSAFILEGNIQALLPSIQAPTLLLYPQGGKTATETQCTIFLEGIRNVRLRRISTPFHMIHLVQPEACCEEIRAFIVSELEPAAEDSSTER